MKFHLLHGKPQDKIRKIVGTWPSKQYILEITNAPTKKRSYGVGYIIFKNKFPEEFWSGTSLALEHYILNYFYKHSKKEGLTWINFQRPTIALIQRSGITVDRNMERIKIKFHFKTPTKGNRINGKTLARAFEKVIPQMVEGVTKLSEEKKDLLLQTKHSLEDQIEIKKQLVEKGYIAFIGEGVKINRNSVRLSEPGHARVPNAGRINGFWIPYGKTNLIGTGLDLIEMLARGYTFYKPTSPTCMVKTIRDVAWVPKGEEWIAAYAGMDAIMGVGDLDYPNAITLDSQTDSNYTLRMLDGYLRLERRIREKLTSMPKYNEVIVKKRLPKVRLYPNSIKFDKTNLSPPYHYMGTIIERNQLRAIVDAINFSQKYVSGTTDISHMVGKTMNVISKKGLEVLGLDFYTEFTRWQLFYLLYKLIQANP